MRGHLDERLAKLEARNRPAALAWLADVTEEDWAAARAKVAAWELATFGEVDDPPVDDENGRI